MWGMTVYTPTTHATINAMTNHSRLMGIDLKKAVVNVSMRIALMFDFAFRVRKGQAK
jgi:hypothetical protein